MKQQMTTKGRMVMTPGELQEATGLSRNSIYTAIQNGEIDHVKIGGRILIPIAEAHRVLGLSSAKDAA